MNSWRQSVTKIMGKSDIPTILPLSPLFFYHTWQFCEKKPYSCITLLDEFTRTPWKKTDTWITLFVVFTGMLWKKKTKSKRQKKTETYITSFDVLTIILWKIPNFKSHFICWQSCCQKMNETCITLVWCVHNNVVKKYRHFYQTFFFVHNKVQKK